MEVKVLGSRGEISASSPYHSKHSGVLIDDKILVDFGESEFLQYKPKHILITHLHPDHAVFILEEIETKIPIYLPQKYNSKLNTKVVNKKFKLNSYAITPIPTIHSEKVKSVAYLIQKGKERILYTGDLVWLEKKYHKLISGVDLIITEGSYIRKGGLVMRSKKSGKIYGHTGIPNLAKLFSRFTKNVLLIHFGSWFYKNLKYSKSKIKQIAEETGLKIIIGYDGLEINTKRLP